MITSATGCAANISESSIIAALVLPATALGLSGMALGLSGMALGLSGMAMVARMTRSSMLDVLGEDYVRTARAKGAPSPARGSESCCWT